MAGRRRRRQQGGDEEATQVEAVKPGALLTDPDLDEGSTTTAASAPFLEDALFDEDTTRADRASPPAPEEEEATVALEADALPDLPTATGRPAGHAPGAGASDGAGEGDPLGTAPGFDTEDVVSLPTMTGMKDDPARGIDAMWQSVAPPPAEIPWADPASDARLRPLGAEAEAEAEAREAEHTWLSAVLYHDGTGWRVRWQSPWALLILAVASGLLAYLGLHAWQNVSSDLASFRTP